MAKKNIEADMPETATIEKKKAFFIRKKEKLEMLNAFVIITFKNGNTIPVFGDVAKILDLYVLFKSDPKVYKSKFGPSMVTNEQIYFDLVDVDSIQKAYPPTNQWMSLEKVYKCDGFCYTCKRQCLFTNEELKKLNGKGQV
jgi:hypothetical protein